MQGILYQEGTIWHFLFVSGLLGGGAAWMTGRACAQTWRSYGRLRCSGRRCSRCSST